MQTFTVHEQPNPPSDRIDRAEALVFIRDGFSWAAAIFTPIWLLLHRLWWALLAYVGIIAVLQVLSNLATVDQRWLSLAGLGVGLLFGFESDNLRRWSLARRGWEMVGSVSGRTLEDCERQFFEGWLHTQPMIAAPTGSVHLIQSPAPRRGWLGFGRLMGT